MKGVKKMISILIRIISIAQMKLLILLKAKKLDHFACKMGLLTCSKTKIMIVHEEEAQIKASWHTVNQHPPTHHPLDFCYYSVVDESQLS
jgi:hypothetical protein